MGVSGNLRMWQTVTVDFQGPTLSEGPATFTDYRLDVTFTNQQTGQTLKVPGFFAADGDAANTNATSGNVWRAHFNPPAAGEWTYTASFRQGTDVAASVDPNAGQAVSFNGEVGSFSVGTAATTGSEFRTDGMLRQDGHYLEHAGNGEIWLKSGANSPENFLGYNGFDGTYDQAGGAIKSYSAHVQDFNAGDPTWDGGKGQGIIGAINYLAEQGVNSQMMLLMNVDGDGKDVWPWTDFAAASRTTYDVSKLAQWEILFEHMDNKGVAMQLVLQETENDQLLGGMTTARAVYYREMVARFGHHNGVVWNMGEETSNTTTEMKSFMQRFKDLDPYDHPVIVHNYPGEQGIRFDPLLGFEPADGISLQATASARADITKYYTNSDNAGDPWLLNWDEIGPPGTGIVVDGASGATTNHKEAREKMWGVFTAGAAGVEWYAGGQDQSLENFRTRESVWSWTEIGRKFWEAQPIAEMKQLDGVTSSSTDFVRAKEGQVYVIYLPDGGASSINLTGQTGTFSVQWFNPVTGAYSTGSVTSVQGGTTQSLGTAPSTQDWVVVVTKSGGVVTPPEDPDPEPEPEPGTFVGTANNDTMTGTTGADRLEGLAGRDTYIVDHAGDVVVELSGGGTDNIKAYVSYTTSANVEDMKLYGAAAVEGTGNASNNFITGSVVANILRGLEGDDRLNGADGADTLYGGAGADKFDYDLVRESTATNLDTIMDFVRGTDDIDLSGIDANLSVSSNQAFTFIGTSAFTAAGQVRYETDGDHLNVYANVDANLQADLMIRLMGTEPLTSTDFIL